MSNSPSSKALLILAMTGSLGIGALAYYVKAEPGAAKVAAVAAPAEPEPTITIRSHRKHRTAPEVSSQVSTEVYTPEIKGPDASLKTASTEVPTGTDPLVFVADKCLKEANVDGVKVLSVEVNDGIALVNFDKEIDGGMGSEQEASFIKALQVAFGQFTNIHSVRIEKENQPIDTLGSIDVSRPLNVVRAESSSSPRSSKSVEP